MAAQVVLLLVALLIPGSVTSLRWPSSWFSWQGSTQRGQGLDALATNGASPVWGCNTLNRGVALTFDDGPSDATHILLDNLKALGVRATFFVCGANVRARPDVVRRAFDEGHEIGLHTWSHANLTHLYANQDMPGLQHELWDTEAEVMAVTGVRPRLFRPPFGAVTPGIVQILADRGYTTVMWSGGCVDWWLDNMTTAVPYMVNGMADSGALLCLHDSYRSTCEGIAQLVKMLTTAEPQTTANPQGRQMLNWDECMGSLEVDNNYH